jgi:hypothetical protein
MSIVISRQKVMFFCLLIFMFFHCGVNAQDETPWRTPEGRACIREWMNLTIAWLNASDLGKDFNDRKPWRFSQYGVLLGKDSWTNAAPDLFSRYENTEHWVWAHYNRNAAGLWTGSYGFFERSTVPIPSCSVYTRACINGNSPTSPAGAIQTTADFVQRSERPGGDGTGDWAFPVRLIGDGTIVMVSITSATSSNFLINKHMFSINVFNYYVCNNT